MISAIILAAGESRRMKSPKPLMNWGDSNLINYQISILDNTKVEEIIIVLGSRANEISDTIHETKFKVVEKFWISRQKWKIKATFNSKCVRI